MHAKPPFTLVTHCVLPGKFCLIAFLGIALSTFGQNQSADQKRLDKLHVKHERWKQCMVILLNGDTVLGRVKPVDDYSNPGLFSDSKIEFAKTNDKEIDLPIAAFKELCIAGEDTQHTRYLNLSVLPGSVGNFSGQLYRVIISGKCLLVFQGQDNANVSFAISGAYVNSIQRYYLFYKNTLTKISMDDLIGGNPAFIRKCGEVFSENQTLMRKIESKVYGPNDLTKIVIEFNALPVGR